jgi:hypothetical protein
MKAVNLNLFEKKNAEKKEGKMSKNNVRES